MPKDRSAYFHDYYLRNKDKPRDPRPLTLIAPEKPRTLCIRCGDRPARKNRRICSRCEGAARIGLHGRQELARFERPPARLLVDTGLRIDDTRGMLITRSGAVVWPVPKRLAQIFYFDQDPKDPTRLRVLDGRKARVAS